MTLCYTGRNFRTQRMVVAVVDLVSTVVLVSGVFVVVATGGISCADGGGAATAAVVGGGTAGKNGTLEDLMHDLRRLANAQFLPRFLEVAFDPNITQECTPSLIKLVVGIMKYDLSSLKMVDAMGRPPAGMLHGALGDLGSYEECLGIRSYNNAGKESFRGKYCNVFFKLPQSALLETVVESLVKDTGIESIRDLDKVVNLGTSKSANPGLRYGMCVPSTCTRHDVAYFLEYFLRAYGVSVLVRTCKQAEPVNLNLMQICTLCLMGLMVFMTAVGTCGELFYPKSDSGNHGIVIKSILSFSLIGNTQRLVRVTPDLLDERFHLRSLHGIRLIAALWVVLGHVYFLTDPMNLSRGQDIFQLCKTFLFCSVTNAFLAVETFFFLSGFLAVYLTLDRMRLYYDRTAFVVITDIIQRYTRFLAPIIMLIGVSYIYPLLASGPMIDEYFPLIEKNLEDHWWQHFLLVINFLNIESQSLGFFWYLCVDFQLRLVFLIVMVLLIRVPKLGLATAVSLIIASCLWVAGKTYFHDYDPLVMIARFDFRNFSDLFSDIYVRPECHAGPYFVGALTAYILLSKEKPKMGKIKTHICWILTAGSMLSVIFGMYEWNKGMKPDRLTSAVYAGGHRVAWCIGLGWIVYACATGNGGIVNRLLSTRSLIPFSRLSFSLYLCHIFVIVTDIFTRTERISLKTFFKVKDFCGILVLSYVLAYLSFVCMEMPVNRIQKLIVNRVSILKLQISSKDASSEKCTELHSKTQNGSCGTVALTIKPLENDLPRIGVS